MMPKRIHDGIKKRCRCGKRQWPKCSHPWWFGFHYNGVEHRYSLDKVARARSERVPVTKAEAATWRDRLRNEIRGGTFAAGPNTAGARLTFGDVCDQYLKRHVRIPTRRPGGRREMEILIAVLRRAQIPAGHGTTMKLEAKPLADITRADVEAVREWRRAEQAAGNARPGTKGGEVGTNRLLSRLRHVFSWAIAEGHVTETPFKRGPVSIVKMSTDAESARTRRLEPSMRQADGTIRDGEETRLLAHAAPHLRSLIIAALSTGARLGELLSLQWSQIRRDEQGQARWLVLTAAKTKTAEARTVPIGPRLRAELEMRRHGPDGKELGVNAYIFGNEVGERVTSIRTAWELTCKRAGITGLHFHDLRREFACRLLESSADLHDVRDFLGHANITTTSRYLQSTPARLERVLERMENAGSAHLSHKSTSELAENASEVADENRVNLLN
jgi:integrase